jgi:hypothetical protein
MRTRVSAVGWIFATIVALAPSSGGRAAATEGALVIPVGLDAYRQWDRWPVQRIGARAYMRSTYDRTGGNRSADASHFLYQLADDNNVTLDVEGAGILYFARYNHWHGSPWRYVVDGTEHIVQETSSADPLHPATNSIFLPEKFFPSPLTWTWAATKGADLMWAPIAFEKSFRMGYSRTRYGTGYYIYHLYAPGAKLSHPIRAWDEKTPPDQDVLDLISRAGTDLTPPGATRGTFTSAEDEINHIVRARGPSTIRKLSFRLPKEHAVALGRARLQIAWDDRPQPSIDAPLALFFGAGTLYNRDEREYLVKAFPMYVRNAGDAVELACFFPMPFFKTAAITLTPPEGESLKGVEWEIAVESLQEPREQVGYFHATYRDHANPKRGEDLLLLDTRATEGGGDWSGSFVGNAWIFSDRAALNTLEGDPRFFFDDSQTPQAYGTGTEEWGGGGDYWGGLNMTLPFAGHPCGARNAKEAKNDEDKIESAYRFLLADLMPFGNRAVIRLEHGGLNDSTEHYQTVTYWYGAPKATLVRTDQLKIGDSASEQAHGYAGDGERYELTSRYEWGPDTFRTSKDGPETVIYGPHRELCRKMTNRSEFVLSIDPNNAGVMLRRTLDYSFPNQRAEIYVADAKSKQVAESKWKSAGVWYLAGANTCVYSDPRGELGATQHEIVTSNRRFRDDEFLLPLELTRGRSKIRVRVVFKPVQRPLFPGAAMPELAWSEIRYEAFSWVMPSSKNTP